MSLSQTFSAAHAALHHVDGRVEQANPVAFGASPGTALTATATPAATSNVGNDFKLGSP